MKEMNLKYLILILLNSMIFGGPGYIYSQETNARDKIFGFHNLSYQEIHEQEFEALDKEDWKKLSLLVDYHISKAKAEKNKIELARGYYYKTDLYDPDIALIYADSIIFNTQESDHPNYPTIGYAMKGHLYFKTGNFPLALENYLVAYNLALEKDNLEHQRENSLAIAAIRNINGQHYAASELYKRSLKLLKNKHDYQNQNYEEYLILLYNLTISHLRLQEIDSARIYSEKGLEQTKVHDDTVNYRDFALLNAQVNYYDNQYEKAKDTLLKYYQFLDGTDRAIKLYYLGKIEEGANPEITIDYFKKIDSIVSFTQDPFIEIKEVYKQLIMQSISENDKQKQVEYIGKLVYYDSLLTTGKENVLNMATAAYDIPLFKYQKRKAEEQIQARGRYALFAVFLAGMGSITGLYYYTKSRRMKSKLKILLQKDFEAPKILKETSAKDYSHPPAVPEDIRNDLLAKLKKFEASDRYLNKDLDMSTLAEELGTNTSYLSVVINHYKKMSFPNYLKDLRITAAIKRLPEDPILLKFNYQGLADTFGFKTGESFSKAFYHKTGVYPSKFINELKLNK